MAQKVATTAQEGKLVCPSQSQYLSMLTRFVGVLTSN